LLIKRSKKSRSEERLFVMGTEDQFTVT